MNKTIKNWTKNTVCENVRLFFPVHFIKSRNEKLYFPIKTVYDLYSTYTYCWSFRAQHIKANHNTYHSLWRIWKTVWLLPERVHVTSVNEFKPSRAKLLTLPGVTKCLHSWKFVTVSYFNYLLLWKVFVQKIISQPVFTASKSISKISFWWYCICLC